MHAERKNTQNQERPFTKAALRERGWRPTMIRDLLGEPDELETNPKYRSAAPMALYAAGRVIAAEDTDDFRARLAKAEGAHAARSAAAQRSMETRRQAAIEWADTVPIDTDWPASAKQAIREGVEHWTFRQYDRGNYDADGKSADPSTKRRWARNYLRHCATSYEGELVELFGVVGKDAAYQVLRARVEEMIEERFPELAESLG